MNIFFDSTIIVYLIASAKIALALLRDRKRAGSFEARHPWLTTSVALLSLVSFLVVFWGSFIEPRLIIINRVAIDLPNFEPAKPVRAALISDIHVGDYKKSGWLTRVVNRIISEKPDLVLLAGDFIVDNPKHAQYLAPLSILHSAFPTFAVLGDHDYNVEKFTDFSIHEDTAQVVRETLAASGVRVLSNETLPIALNNATFTLVGLDDWLAGKTDMPEALAECTKLSFLSTKAKLCRPIIVLVHNPDFILDPESKNADLILAGNTHGGQIRLPLIGAISELPSKLPREFDEGLFDLQYTETLPPELRRQGLLFITSGIGESGPRARLFNPPEIVILELR